MFKKFRRVLLRHDAYPNLYSSLLSVQSAYDLTRATDSELVHLWGNSWRLIDGLIAECKQRGIDTDELFKATKLGLENGNLENE